MNEMIFTKKEQKVPTWKMDMKIKDNKTKMLLVSFTYSTQ